MWQKSPVGSPRGPRVRAGRSTSAELRAAQGAVGVLLLGGLRLPRAGPRRRRRGDRRARRAAFGPRVNLFHAAYRAVVGPRLKPAEDTVAAADVRALDVLADAACSASRAWPSRSAST